MRWRFADKILSFEAWRSILTIKAGSLEEYSLLERWGEQGRAPAILMLESCIQSARWLAEASSEFSVSLEPLGITGWQAMEGLATGERLYSLLRVEERSEDRITLVARQRRIPPGVAFGFAEAASGWEEASPMRLTARLTPLADRYAPADRACLWQELRA